MKHEYDELTGLPKYDAFVERLEACVAQEKTCVSLALFDVDRIGTLNKKHGRAVGDQLLVALAKHLKSTLADYDVYRYGGDAFAVLMADVEKERAFLLAEKSREQFVPPADLKGVTISAGVASCPDDGADVSAVIRKVNTALYRTKVKGGNRIGLAREEKMVTKTSHYDHGQLQGLTRLAKRMGVGEALLLREALDDLLRKHNG